MSGEASPVQAALELFHQAGDVFEIRILGVPRQQTVSGYFNDPTAAADAIQTYDGQAEGIYFTPNPVQPDLLARAVNRLKPYAKNTTCDEDIVNRRWLLVDADPVRASGISSTEQELEAALDRIRTVRVYLEGTLGWPAPVAAGSGNGGHAAYRLALPNDEESRDLVRRSLEALADLFDDDKVTIDRRVFNAARIWKLYGTRACKGDPTPGRPHRRSTLLEVPAHLQIVTREQLEGLARLAPELADSAGRANDCGDRLDAAAWLREHGFQIRRTKSEAAFVLHELQICPFNPEHSRGEAYVIQFSNGAIAAGCHHASCNWSWRDLREREEPRTLRLGQALERHGQTPDGAEGSDTAEEWDEPLPLACPLVAPFPLDALPPVLGVYVSAVADTVQVPLDMPGVLGLVVVAAAAAGKFEVAVGETHLEPANLYAAIASEPGTRKSEAIRNMVFPLEEVERDLLEAAKLRIAQAGELRLIEEERLKELRRRAARVDDACERDDLSAEAASLAAALTEVPPSPRLLVDDVTPERLASLLSENGGRLAAFSSEGGVFGMMAGRYTDKGGPNLDVYLKGHAGDRIVVDRSGRSEVVPRPAITFGLMVQLQVLKELAGNKAFRGRGLLGRFLYVLPESLVGRRSYQNRPIDPAARRAYGALVHAISDLASVEESADSPARHYLQLEGQALEIWVTFHDEVERRQAEGGDLLDISDWASKAAGAVDSAGCSRTHGCGITCRTESSRSLPAFSWRIVKRKLPPYLMRVEREGGRRRVRRRQLALTMAVIVTVVVVIALAFTLPGGKNTAGSTSTSTSTRQVSSSTTSTSRPAATTTTAVGPANGAAVYSASLTGQNEIPAVSTSASGILKLTVATGGSSVDYILMVTKITDVTVARLHEDKTGSSGPTIITLYGGPGRGGVFTGVLAQGTLTAANLQGPLQGKKVADFVALIKSGQVYLNVGTSKHIGGEIRGQIK